MRKHWETVPAPSSGLGVAEVTDRFSRWLGYDVLSVVPGEHPLFAGRSTVQAYDNQALPWTRYITTDSMVRCMSICLFARSQLSFWPRRPAWCLSRRRLSLPRRIHRARCG